MKRALHFATKLNSRDIQKCNCFWVPSYDLLASACKAVFPAPTATEKQQSFLNQNIPPPPPPNKNSWVRPFPPSAIAMLFTVTQECTRELKGQNNIAQEVGRGATLFSFDKMVAWREIEKYMEMSQQFCPGL